MTEPLPCPFCGHVGLSHNEGSTFRWLSTECNGCGAQCGEERINTMTMERSAAIEQAKVAAIKTWNTRFTPFPFQQQAEPVGEVDAIGLNGTDFHVSFTRPMPLGTKLYTTPLQRQWVGLTDEDVNRESAMIASQMKLAFHAGMYVAQKILKERNT